jgi:hypothetical protein
MAGLLNWNPYGSPLMGQGAGEMPAYGKLNAPSISEAEELLPYLLLGGAYRKPPRFPAKRRAPTAQRTKKKAEKRRRKAYDKKIDRMDSRHQEHLDRGGDYYEDLTVSGKARPGNYTKRIYEETNKGWRARDVDISPEEYLGTLHTKGQQRSIVKRLRKEMFEKAMRDLQRL